MANYYKTLITFNAGEGELALQALYDLHNHIATAVQITNAWKLRPRWIHSTCMYTKFYTVAMTYNVQTLYDIGRCSILNMDNQIDPCERRFGIVTNTAYSPMILFWYNLISMFYPINSIHMRWRTYPEFGSVITNDEPEEILYSLEVMARDDDSILRLDRLFDTSNAPFYRIVPHSQGGDIRLYKFEWMYGGAGLEVEDFQRDLSESECVKYLRSLSSKYDDMQSFWQVLTDSKYMFDGDLNIAQDSVMSTNEIISQDFEDWASTQDPETLEGLDFEDMVYKVYDDPRLFVQQQPIRPEPCNQQQFPDCTDGNIIN